MYAEFSKFKDIVNELESQAMLAQSIATYSDEWSDVAYAAVLWECQALPIIATDHSKIRTAERSGTSYVQETIRQLVDVIENSEDVQDVLGSSRNGDEAIIYSEKYEIAYIVMIRNDAIGLKTIVSREPEAYFYAKGTSAYYLSLTGKIVENNFFR